jgi:hypothetical protein
MHDIILKCSLNDERDKARWDWKKKFGCFSVKSTYNHLGVLSMGLTVNPFRKPTFPVVAFSASGKRVISCCFSHRYLSN